MLLLRMYVCTYVRESLNFVFYYIGLKNEDITSLMDLTAELTEDLVDIVIDNNDTIENQQNPKYDELEEAPMESSQHTLSQMVVQQNNSVFPTEGMCVGVCFGFEISKREMHKTSS